MKRLFKFNHYFLIWLFLYSCLAVQAEPLALTDWKQPYSEKEINFPNYTSVLNCEKKTPYYVFYNLDCFDFEDAFATRKNKWPKVVPQEIQNICGTDYATSQDYKDSGYDRGHLAPASDFKSDQNMENFTFSFANAAPQDKSLNRGGWEELEKYERHLAIDHKGITVITGVIQSKDTYIGNNVGVPDYFYKIILWKEDGKIHLMAFSAPNIKSFPEQIDVTLLELEAGLDFGF